MMEIYLENVMAYGRVYNFTGPPATNPSLRPIECEPLEPKPMALSHQSLSLWGLRL